MENNLIKALLHRETYNKYCTYIKLDSFADKNIKTVYQSLVEAHRRFDKDITVEELKGFHYSLNPTLSAAYRQNLDTFFSALESNDISQIVAQDIVKSKLKFDAFTELAELAIDGADKEPDYARLQDLLDIVKGNNLVTEETGNIVDVTATLDELLDFRHAELKWKYPLPQLQEVLGGIGPGVFCLIAARPNAGKTAFVVSLACHPEGFLKQGAKVRMMGCEEHPKRTLIRCYSCLTGFQEEELEDIPANTANRKSAIDQWGIVQPNFVISNVVAADLRELEDFVKKNHKDVDILFIDQLDKIKVHGAFAGDHDRLRYLYTSTRELAKRYGIAIIGVCQASNDAEGKLYFGLESLENSKTGKAAEIDVGICIGRESPSANNGVDNGYRVANIAKNKLTGKEVPVPFMLESKISRIYA